MGKKYSSLEEVRAFIERQPMFFVGSAPLDAQGHVNISPKGLDSVRILGPQTIAYLDLTGSGIETTAHVRENGRIVLMFCAFEGAPNILRLHGRGRAVPAGDAEFAALAAKFPPLDGARSVIVVEVNEIADSCGMAVPLMKYEGQRDGLTNLARKLGAAGLEAYRREKNQQSLDGLKGI